MNNLKRVLSLGLSGVMLAGLLTVGASAADFTDAEDIQHTDAVNTLVALNVINGKDDGSFAPEETVTRSQMAKMIAVAMNGGNETTTGVKTNPSFTDIKGHWAESYIEFCSDLDIISGRGDGTFDPDATVTGLEAAKMVLTALGYNGEAYQLVGAKWATRTDELARAAKPSLYEDLVGVSMSGPASRDVAAQLIWNGMQNDTMTVTPDTTLSTGEITWSYGTTERSLLEERYGATTEYAYLTDVSYDKDKEEFTYSLTKNASFGADAIDDDPISVASLTSKDDVSNLFGQKVKVVYKTDKSKSVYGIFADSDSAILDSDAVDKLPSMKASDTSLKFNGVTYKVNADDVSQIDVYAFNAASPEAKKLHQYEDAATKPYTLDLIDNDGDGKINVAVVHPVTVAKVTFVGKDSITAGNVAYKFADCDIYEDVAKNDWAIVTPKEYTATGEAVVAKAEIVNGTIQAIRNTDGTVKVNDTWYTKVAAFTGDAITSLNEEFDLVVLNGFIFNAEQISETATAKDAVYVLKADDEGKAGSTTAGTQQVQLLFADGTKKIVTVDKIDAKTPGTMDAPATDNKAAVGEIYTYATDKDGNYELSQVVDADYDAVKTSGSTAITVDDGKASGGETTTTDFRFNDEAVIFVTADSGKKVEVLSGATVAKWSKSGGYATTGSSDKSVLYANKSDGFNKVVLGLLNLTESTVPGAAGDTAYGWLTADSARVKDGDDYYIQMTLWNGSEEITVLAETVDISGTDTSVGASTSVDGYKKGTPVSYKDLGNDKIDTVVALDTADAVVGYSGGKDIEFESAGSGTIDNDTVILYVNTADNEGVEGGSITIAQEDALGNNVKNVYAEVDDGNVTYIIVDTANNLAENKDLEFVADGSVVTEFKKDDNTMAVASGTKASGLDTEVAKLAGYCAHQIVKSATDSATVTGETELANGNILQVTALDGSYYYFVITVNA